MENETTIYIEQLLDRMKKLFFLNDLIVCSGAESKEALYVIEDEIHLLENIYIEAQQQLEMLI